MIVLPLNRPMVAIEKNDMCGKKFCLRCLVCMLVVSCEAVARAQQTSEEAILAFTGAADFSELDQEEFESVVFEEFDEQYMYFLAIALVFFVVEMLIGERKFGKNFF